MKVSRPRSDRNRKPRPRGWVVTIEMYLREGSFIPWVANRLSTSLNLNPDEYAPINAIALDDEPENDDFLPEAVRITSKDMNKIADLVVEKLLDAFEYRPEDKPFIMVGKSE